MRQKSFRKYSRIGSLLLCGILLFGGCGKDGGESGFGGTNDSQGDSGALSDTAERMAYKDMRYLPTFTDTSERYGAYESAGVGFADDIFYLVKRKENDAEDDNGQLIAYHPDTGEEEVLLDCDGMLTAAPLQEGSVMVLSVSDETSYRLSRVDSGGEEIFSREYTDQALNEWRLNLKFAADSRDRCYLLTNNEIVLFDEQGKAAGKIDLSGKLVTQMVCGGSGKVYIFEYYSKQLVPVDFETASLGTAPYQLPVTILRGIAGSQKADFLLCDDTTVYEYQCEDGKLTPLFDLQDSQISDGFSIDTIGEMEDGRVFLFSRYQESGAGSTEAALLTPTPLAQCPVKEVVTIGTESPSTKLLEAAAAFNRQNEDFHVSILNYSVGGRNFLEARAALKLDLSIGKGPDICELDWLEGKEDLYAKGCFVDLSGYLDGSGKYKKEDFVRQALETFSYGDQLLAIPKYFSLQTIAASPEVVGENAGWDLEDVKSAVRAHPEAVVFAEVGSSYMLEVCIRNMMGEFVDFEKGEAYFDTAAYIDLLDFVKSLPDNYDENESTTYTNEWLQEGKALFSIRDIGRLTDLQVLEANFGGKYTCIGYPTPDGSPDCIIRGREAYAITANAADKDRAWKFLEWFQSTQGEETSRSMVTRAGFPSRIDVFERELKEAVENPDGQKNVGGITTGGITVRFHSTTQEETELIRALTECASPERSTEDTILDIMSEEAVYLFDGSKTAEDVAKVTQNRVQLYLGEK